MNTPRTGKRRRFTPLALLTGAAGVVLLSISMTSTVSAFTASITDTGSTGTAAALAMQAD